VYFELRKIRKDLQLNIFSYQTTYTGAASHYNTMSAPRQLIMPTVAPPPKKQPTPLAAVQPFAAYK
jgi:hypothetical protein